MKSRRQEAGGRRQEQAAGGRKESIFHFSFKICHFVIAERYPSVNGK
jgi:hypothetical protein